MGAGSAEPLWQHPISHMSAARWLSVVTLAGTLAFAATAQAQVFKPRTGKALPVGHPVTTPPAPTPAPATTVATASPAKTAPPAAVATPAPANPTKAAPSATS